MSDRLKTVFHIHTNYSDDGNASPEDILREARRKGIHCIAVTDHDTIDGAVQLVQIAGPSLRVIIGQEISTLDGHLIGLFLHEPVEPGRPARWTAEQIRNQGGLVVAPHPFNTVFGCSLREAVHQISDLIDVVEVTNAQNLLPYADRKAAAFAREHDLPGIVGADAHHRGFLDRCYQWVSDFGGPREFLAALRAAHFLQSRHPLTYFARSAHVYLRGTLGLRPPAGYGVNCRRVRTKRLLHADLTEMPQPRPHAILPENWLEDNLPGWTGSPERSSSRLEA